MRLWRARRSSFRFLCLRIFLRRFLMTLPKTHLSGKIESRPLDTATRRQSQPAAANRPRVRQIENMALAVPLEIACRYPERVQELLGHNVFEPTFIGYVDGMHPKRLLGPEYAARNKRAAKIVSPG